MMLKIIPHNTNIPFLKFRKLALIASLLLVLGSLGAWFTIGLNTGIDFRGGFIIEVRSNSGPANIEELRGDLGALGLGDVSMQEFGVDPTILTGNLDANEDDKIFDVSFLGRDLHSRQDIHMKIIMENH